MGPQLQFWNPLTWDPQVVQGVRFWSTQCRKQLWECQQLKGMPTVCLKLYALSTEHPLHWDILVEITLSAESSTSTFRSLSPSYHKKLKQANDILSNPSWLTAIWLYNISPWNNLSKSRHFQNNKYFKFWPISPTLTAVKSGAFRLTRTICRLCRARVLLFCFRQLFALHQPLRVGDLPLPGLAMRVSPVLRTPKRNGSFRVTPSKKKSREAYTKKKTSLIIFDHCNIDEVVWEFNPVEWNNMWRLVVATGMWQKHAETCEHPHHYTLKTNMKLPNIGVIQDWMMTFQLWRCNCLVQWVSMLLFWRYISISHGYLMPP